MTSTKDLVPIILDCDPGHDDAIAMVVAARHTNLLGITTVAGNAPLESTTRNALVVRDLLGIDAPVHAGANRPLVAPPRHAGYVHGESGLDGAQLPPPSGPPASRDAIGFIIDTVRNNDGVWLVPTGPLTNIALALRSAPDIAARIAGISFMGGGLFGNRTATAEFNIWADPEAAQAVFSFPIPKTMIGLDVTHRAVTTPAIVERLVATGAVGAFVADLVEFFAVYHQETYGWDGAPIHDAVAVAHVIRPGLVTTVDCNVEVELVSDLCRGRTVVDLWRRTDREPNADVGVDLDTDAFFDLLVERIGRLS